MGFCKRAESDIFPFFCTQILTKNTDHGFDTIAAFQIMRVPPAKQSYVLPPRKCNFRADRHTDRQIPGKVVPMFRSEAKQKYYRHKI